MPGLSRSIYFLSENCNDEEEDWPVNGRASTVCLKNISVLDVCTENGTREEREKVTKELNFLPICLSSTAIYISL